MAYLNGVMIKNKYPQTWINYIFNQLTSAFLKIDMQLGYHQNKIRSKDVPKQHI